MLSSVAILRSKNIAIIFTISNKAIKSLIIILVTLLELQKSVPIEKPITFKPNKISIYFPFYFIKQKNKPEMQSRPSAHSKAAEPARSLSTPGNHRCVLYFFYMVVLFKT